MIRNNSVSCSFFGCDTESSSSEGMQSGVGEERRVLDGCVGEGDQCRGARPWRRGDGEFYSDEEPEWEPVKVGEGDVLHRAWCGSEPAG